VQSEPGYRIPVREWKRGRLVLQKVEDGDPVADGGDERRPVGGELQITAPIYGTEQVGELKVGFHYEQASMPVCLIFFVQGQKT
jgi:hypothetical protein